MPRSFRANLDRLPATSAISAHWTLRRRCRQKSARPLSKTFARSQPPSTHYSKHYGKSEGRGSSAIGMTPAQRGTKLPPIIRRSLNWGTAFSARRLRAGFGSLSGNNLATLDVTRSSRARRLSMSSTSAIKSGSLLR